MAPPQNPMVSLCPTYGAAMGSLWGSCGAGRTQQGLPLAHPQLMVELLADHPAPGIEFVGRHVRDLQQHGRHQVDALQQLQVDVHVERHLAPLLHLWGQRSRGQGSRGHGVKGQGGQWSQGCHRGVMAAPG